MTAADTAAMVAVTVAVTALGLAALLAPAWAAWARWHRPSTTRAPKAPSWPQEGHPCASRQDVLLRPGIVLEHDAVHRTSGMVVTLQCQHTGPHTQHGRTLQRPTGVILAHITWNTTTPGARPIPWPQ